MQESGILAQPDLEHLKRRRLLLGGVALLATLGMAAAIAVVPNGSDSNLPVQTVVENLRLENPRPLSLEGALFLREERIQRDDTLGTLLARLGVHDLDAVRFLRTHPSTQAMHRQLSPGRTVVAETSAEGELHRLIFPLNGNETVLLIERANGNFQATEQALRYETRTVVRSAEIRHSLFGATDANDIPDGIATQLADIFGADIDFHRDLRKGDRFSLVYEMHYLRGQPARSGRVLGAEFINNGRMLRALYFEQNGKGGYYNAEGKSLKKAFLRSPLEFSRVTSNFGLRLHPILNDYRAHKGIDYGAPTGTKVRAVGDATVEFAGRQGGYGNLIVLRHRGPYATAYGHLSGFARGLKKGMRVSQGDTIGYVGATGWATGPHLHYEFRVNQQQVNPQTLALPATEPIEAAQLPHFKALASSMLPQLELVRQSRVATALN